MAAGRKSVFVHQKDRRWVCENIVFGGAGGGRVCRDLRQDRLVFTQKDKKEKEEGGEMRKLSLFHIFLFFLLTECRATPVATNSTEDV